MGDKISAKRAAEESKVPIIDGSDFIIHDVDTAMKIADEIGYPVMLKASNGGGGRGMRIVQSQEEMEEAFEKSRNESKRVFGEAKLFIEKYLIHPKHIEVQILGDNYGNIVHLYDRDCSLQRRDVYKRQRKNSVKNTRINSEVLKELSRIISREIKDPRIAPMTSVVSVEVAPDLKTCKAYISVLGDKEAQESTLEGLRSAHGYIRRELARSINLRNTPDVRFILDQSIEYGVSMSKKIDEINAAMHEREREASEE